MISDLFRAVRPFFWLCIGLFLGGFASYSFGGDRYVYGGATEGSKDNAVDRCIASSSSYPESWIGSQCAYSGPACPSSQDGGTCEEIARFSYYSYGNRSQDPMWSGQNFKYAYCPDASPTFDGTKCVKPEEVCDGKAIGTSSISAVLTGEPKGNQVCINHCVYTGSKVVCAPTMDGGTTSGGDAVSLAKVCEISGPFTANKRSCDASASGEPNIAKPYADPPKPWYDNGKGIADCASSGGSWGSVNGKEVCVRGTSGSTPGAGSGAGSSGSSSDTKSKTEATPDGGSKTTDTKTDVSCTDGKCTTTTTTTTTVTHSDGTKTTSSETTKDDTSQSSFCVANPTNSLCAKNTFGGDCTAGFSCSGDSVQCALARVTHEARCASKWMTTPGDPTTSTAKVEEKAIDVAFEWNPFGSDMSCPADKHITTVAGISVDWSYSDFCTFATNIRPIVIILGWITAAYIVFGFSAKKED